ncbi:MAG: type II toxin-antitoxin system HicB family antitoxin [Sarcina sp.]
MQIDNYRFLAVFTKSEESYEVEFPDIENCFTFGESFDEVIKNAKDVLGLILFDMEEDKIEIPKPSDPLEIKINKNQFLMPVEVYMPLVRNDLNNKVDKKTLTIPHWLNKLATNKNINFSQLLQTALKKELNID